ncbi:FtsQ-type POTRA domain-containing protein [Candidatus Saganbacteria bacterium]|nr:FtsQ-type POTRA domain-containing protein [Candidatus Saganbacteria bacterium]
MAKKGKKQKNNRIKRRPGFFIFVLFVLLASGGLWYFLNLPLWSIKDVVVNGTKILAAEDVKALAGIPLSENLFFTSFSRARANLRKITAIEKFHLYRIPPGTVLINITERQPVAMVVFPKQSAIIDAQGYVLNRNANITLNIPNLVDLPVVSGVAEKNLMRGERIDGQATEVINQIISKLGAYFKTQRLQIDLGRLENISIRLEDILLIKIGAAENIIRKMTALESLLAEVQNRWPQVDYIDVRFPDNPVIRFKS